MEVFKSYCHKNILKTSGLLLTSKSCFIKSFVLNNKSVEKISMYNKLFSFLSWKIQTWKTKININYLIIMQIKIRLSIFLVFGQCGLACKYGIIFQNIWNLTQFTFSTENVLACLFLNVIFTPSCIGIRHKIRNC